MAGRADPFGDLDLSDFAPGAAKKPQAQKAAIRQVSEANDFPSRAAAPVAPATSVKPVRRRRTGRNMQVNIKATPDTIARFTALADARGVAFGELLEQLVAAAETP